MRLVALLLALASLRPAWAQEGVFLDGTMKAIGDRGTILIGYREGAVPFSFLNPGKQPVGFSVDICNTIAADVAAALNRDLLEPDAPAWQRGLRIAYVPVAADARLPMLVDGRIDLECGSTTANAERSRTVAFSPVFFLAGTKLAVPGKSTVASFRDLADKTVAVSAGTTNAGVIQRVATTLSPPMKVVQPPSLEAAYALLTAGKADAIASDDILLVGLQAGHAAGQQFRIVGDYLSFEPYAIAFRRNDPAFADIVQRSFERLADAGTLASGYNRWFTGKLPNGETMNLPMSPQLTELFRGLGRSD